MSINSNEVPQPYPDYLKPSKGNTPHSEGNVPDMEDVSTHEEVSTD